MHEELQLKKMIKQTRLDPSTPLLLYWVLFGILTLSNALLSYIPMPASSKIAVFLCGILLPVFLWVRRENAPGSKEKPFYLNEFMGPCPSWVWILLMGIALGLRFWQVTSLELWPTGDEALHAEAGLAIAERGDWRFLYTAGQAPPTLFWIYGVFFKLFHSVPFNLWVPPAIISFLTVFMGYGAARQYFSKSLSFLVA